MSNQNLYKTNTTMINKPSFSIPKLYRPMKTIKINTPSGVIQSYFDKIINKDFETAKTIFIDNEMSLYVVNDNKETVLHYILRTSSEKNEPEEDILDIINNVDNIWNLISIKNKFNQTPLHLMCMYQLYKVYNSIPQEYKELIDYNIPDSYGRTPYMYTLIGKRITEPLSKTILSYLLNKEINDDLINQNKVEYYTALTTIKNNNVINEETKKENFEEIKIAINKLFAITSKNNFDIPNIGKVYKIENNKYFLRNVYRNINTLDYYYYVPELKIELEKKIAVNDNLKDEYNNSINNYKNANILSNIISVEEKDGKPDIKFNKNIQLSNSFNKKIEEENKNLKKEDIENFKENNKNIDNYIYYDALFVPLIDNYLEKYIEKNVCVSINEIVMKQLESDKLSEIKDYDKIDFSIFCKNFNEIEYNSFHITNYVKSILTLMDFYNIQLKNSKGLKEKAYNILLQSLNVIRYLKTETIKLNELIPKTYEEETKEFEDNFVRYYQKGGNNKVINSINIQVDTLIKLFIITIQNKSNDTVEIDKIISKLKYNIELYKIDENIQDDKVIFYQNKIKDIIYNISSIIEKLKETFNTIIKINEDAKKIKEDADKKLLEINKPLEEIILYIKSNLQAYIKSYNEKSNIIINNIQNSLIYFEKEENQDLKQTILKYSTKLYNNMINTIIKISKIYPNILRLNETKKYIENIQTLINSVNINNETIINQFNLIKKRFNLIKNENDYDNEYIVYKHLINVKSFIKAEEDNIEYVNLDILNNETDNYKKNKQEINLLKEEMKNKLTSSYEFIISKNIELIKENSENNYDNYILSQTFNSYNFINNEIDDIKIDNLITTEIPNENLPKNKTNIYEYFKEIYQNKNKEIDIDYLIKQNDEILIEGSLQANIDNIKNIINEFIKNIKNDNIKKILTEINNDIENIVSIHGVNFAYNVLYEIFETLYYDNDTDKFNTKKFPEQIKEINIFKLKVGDNEDENEINLFKQALINNILYYNYDNDDVNYTFKGFNKLIIDLVNKLCYSSFRPQERNNLGILHLLKKDNNMHDILHIPENINLKINRINEIINNLTINGSARAPDVGAPAFDGIINNDNQTFNIKTFTINNINIKYHITGIDNLNSLLKDFDKTLNELSAIIQYNIENIKNRILEIKENINYINLQNQLIQFIYNLKDTKDIYYINTFINNINNFDNNPIVDRIEGREAHITENPPIKTIVNYNNTLNSLRNYIIQKINIEIKPKLIKEEKYNNLINILQKYSKQIIQFDKLKLEIKNNEHLSNFVSSNLDIHFPLLIILSKLYELVQPENNVNYNILDYLNETLNRNDFNIQNNYQDIINIIIKLINIKVNNYSDDFVKDIIKEFIEIKKTYNIHILNGINIDLGNNDYNNAANAIIGNINIDDFSYNSVLNSFNDYYIQNNNIKINILKKIFNFILTYRLEYNPECYKEIIKLINKMDNDYLFNLTKTPKLILNNNVSVFLSILFKVFEKERIQYIVDNQRLLSFNRIDRLDFNTKQFIKENNNVSIENLTVDDIETTPFDPNIDPNIDPIPHQPNSSDIITHIIKLSFKNRSFNEMTDEDIMNIYDITQFNNVKLYHLYKNVEIIDNYINGNNPIEIQSLIKDLYKEIQDYIPDSIYYKSNNNINNIISKINSSINEKYITLINKEINNELIKSIYTITSIIKSLLKGFNSMYIPYIRIILDSIKNNGLSKDCFDLSEIYRKSLGEIDKFIGENNVYTYNNDIHTSSINEPFIKTFEKIRYYNDYDYNVHILTDLYDLTDDKNIQKDISIIINILQLTSYDKFINNRLIYVNDDSRKEEKRKKYTSIVDCIFNNIPDIPNDEVNDIRYIYNLKLIENITCKENIEINQNNKYIIPSLTIKQIYRMNNKQNLLKYIILNKLKYCNIQIREARLDEWNEDEGPIIGGYYLDDINYLFKNNHIHNRNIFNDTETINENHIDQLFNLYINSSVNNVLFLSNHTNLKPEFNNPLFKQLYYNQLFNNDYIHILSSFILSYDKFKDNFLYNIYVYSVIIKYISLIKDYDNPSNNKTIKFMLDYINSILNSIYIKLKETIKPENKEEIIKIKSYINFINPLINNDNINDIDTIADEELNKYTVDKIHQVIIDNVKSLLKNEPVNQDINIKEIIFYLYKNLKKGLIPEQFMDNNISKYLYNHLELQAYINSYDTTVYSYDFNNSLMNALIKINKIDYIECKPDEFSLNATLLTGGLNPYSIPVQIINKIFDSNINKYQHLLLFNKYDRIKKLILSTNIIRVIVIINLLNNDPQKIKYQKFNHYKKKIMKPLLDQLNNKFDKNVQKDLFYLLDDIYINMTNIIYKIQRSYYNLL